MNAKSPGFIRACSNHAPAVRVATNNHRAKLKLWVVSLFYRSVKSIHINVDYFTFLGHKSTEPISIKHTEYPGIKLLLSSSLFGSVGKLSTKNQKVSINTDMYERAING